MSVKSLSPNEVTQWRLSLCPTDESHCICSIINVTNWVSVAKHQQLPLNAIGVAKENKIEIFEIE